MKITNFNFSEKKVTALAQEGDYLWIAFQGTGGNSTLYKSSATKPDQIFYDLTVAVDNIERMKINGNYIYLCVDDDTNICVIYSIINPLTTYYDIAIPAGYGIADKAVDICFDDDYFYLLIPGEESGDISRILVYDILTRVLEEVIELTGIHYARTMDNDALGNIWIVTYENPSTLVKVYQESGGAYIFQSWLM